MRHSNKKAGDGTSPPPPAADDVTHRDDTVRKPTLQDGFTKIEKRLLSFRYLTYAHKRVFMGMVSFANVSGFCYASKQTIAIQSGVSVRTVQRALKALEKADVIKPDHPAQRKVRETKCFTNTPTRWRIVAGAHTGQNSNGEAFAMVPRRMVSDTAISSAGLIILAVLNGHDFGEGARIGVGDIAEKAGLKNTPNVRRYVRRVLKSLEDQGVLEVLRRKGCRACYIVTYPTEGYSVSPPHEDHSVSPPDHSVSPRGAILSPHRGLSCPTKDTPKENIKRNEAKENAPQGASASAVLPSGSFFEKKAEELLKQVQEQFKTKTGTLPTDNSFKDARNSIRLFIEAGNDHMTVLASAEMYLSDKWNSPSLKEWQSDICKWAVMAERQRPRTLKERLADDEIPF